MTRTAVYLGTRNIYGDIYTSLKSLLYHDGADRVYLLIEDDSFPFPLPQNVIIRNMSGQSWFPADSVNYHNRWTYMILLRAALTKLLPDEDRVLSLDADVLVDGDVSALWQMDLREVYLAGAREPAKSGLESPYVNIGVSLLNLKKLREDGMDDKLIHALNVKQYPFCEQDCFNELCAGQIAEFPARYNANHYTELTKNAVIRHFAAETNWRSTKLVKKYRDMHIPWEQKHKKLQILVPHYNESASVIKPLLDSVAMQQAVDLREVGVVICHDGNETEDFWFSDYVIDDETCLPHYPFDIEQVRIPHRGVSAARNAALDAATADYVMFCDADDMFFNACGLWVIFREMASGFDSMTSEFVEEKYLSEQDKTVFISKERDSTFVHGKVHRRAYLAENNIRWNESLTVHEDSYFNILCQSLSENVKYCTVPFYLWKWRDDSICRHDPKYILKTYHQMLDSNDALVCELLRRGKPEDAEFYAVSMIFDSYYTMNKPEWVNQENREYRRAVERRFARYYKDHKDLWDGATMEHKMTVSNISRGRAAREGMLMEDMTVGQWLRHIEGLN